jgi:hypothetical protein
MAGAGGCSSKFCLGSPLHAAKLHAAASAPAAANAENAGARTTYLMTE